jgi:hypothetical protein
MPTARSWSQQDADDYHLARELIGSVVAALMARVVDLSDPEEVGRIKAEISRHSRIRRAISVENHSLVAEVLRDYPAILRRVEARRGAQ